MVVKWTEAGSAVVHLAIVSGTRPVTEVVYKGDNVFRMSVHNAKWTPKPSPNDVVENDAEVPQLVHRAILDAFRALEDMT